jgi:paraquat-inducible protein A
MAESGSTTAQIAPMPSTGDVSIRACPCCGLAQVVARPDAGQVMCCARCGARLTPRLGAWRSNSRTAAIALAALVLYPLAVTLPMIEIEQFGHHREASIIQGVIELLARGHLLVGLVVLLCSIVLPLGKLAALLALSVGGLGLARHHQALTYRIVEFTGRWGMLDVLLVAILVAALKLGDLVEVNAGPAAIAFTICVVLSLLAAASFDPHRLWASNDHPESSHG